VTECVGGANFEQNVISLNGIPIKTSTLDKVETRLNGLLSLLISFELLFLSFYLSFISFLFVFPNGIVLTLSGDQGNHRQVVR
jgi:hypothetical protein